MSSYSSLLNNFCRKHALPNTYAALAEQYFVPLAAEISAVQKNTPFMVGINGSQGSGKSTLADLLKQCLEQAYNKTVLSISIDDFYHTQATRQHLAETVHPLFITRGVPGTHDMALLADTLQHCKTQTSSLRIPQFNKAMDDRHPESAWLVQPTPIDIIILEGWCVGAEPQSVAALAEPVNALESEEDSHGTWRQYANQQLSEAYQTLFAQLDWLLMLKAPSFDCVYQWREKQEAKLRDKVEGVQHNVMSPAQVKRFIQHYQRLTEHMLATLPAKADVVFALTAEHGIAHRQS